MKYLLGISLLFFCSCGKTDKSNIDSSNTISNDSIKTNTLDYTKEEVFLDTIFPDNSHLTVSSYWQEGDFSNFLDSIILKITAANDTTLLVYKSVAIVDAIVKQLVRKTDKKNGIYCFIKFYGAITPDSEIMIAYRQYNDKCSQITFNADNCIRYGPDCGIDSINVNRLVMFCSAFPRVGRKNDETNYYTRNTDTSFVLTRTKVKK